MKRSITVVAVVVALIAVSVSAQDAAPLAKITQQLSSPNVNLGDIVYVCLAVENYSGEVVKVTDILPNALSYLPGSLRVNGASAVCTVDCSTLVIDRMDFMDLVSDRVELLHGIFLALTDRLRALLAVTEGGGLAENEFDDGNTNPV